MWIASTACATAWSPDPQTRLTVSAGTSIGRPALSAACRATFIPAPDCSTQPSTTSSTSRGSTPARATASRMTMAPRSTAERSFSAPPKDPMGVRQALRMTGYGSGKCGDLRGHDQIGARCPPHAIESRVLGNLPEDETLRLHLDDGHLGDDHVHAAETGERQR